MREEKRWVENPPPKPRGGATLRGPQGLSKVAPSGVTSYRSVEGCRGATGASVAGPRGASSWCCDGLAGLSYQRLRPRPAWMMLWRLPHASSDWPPCLAVARWVDHPGRPGQGGKGSLPPASASTRRACPAQVSLPGRPGQGRWLGNESFRCQPARYPCPRAGTWRMKGGLEEPRFLRFSRQVSLPKGRDLAKGGVLVANGGWQ